MAFDVEGARKAGYSDAEIVDHLADQSKFNAKQARAAGYSDDELLQHLTGQSSGPAPAPKLSKEDTPDLPNTLMIGAGKTFDRVLDGLTQAWLGAKGDTKALAGLKENVDEKDRLYKPLTDARPIATAVGESMPSMVLPGGGATNSVRALGKLAASAAIPAALEYGSPEERAVRAAGSAAGAVVGGVVVPKVVGAGVDLAKRGVRALAGEVSPAVAALAAKAEQLGIPVSAAQLSGSKFLKAVSSASENLPLSGATKTAADQRREFTRAVSRTFGEDTDTISPDVYRAARGRLGTQFETLSARNNLQVDPALLHQLGNVSEEATRFGSSEATRAVQNAIDELMSKMDPATGTIPGKAYQTLDSKLSKLTKTGDEKSVYLGQLQSHIRDAMDHSITSADKEAWDTARSQYKNLKAVRDLVAKDGANGLISPEALMGRLNANEASRNAMAAGTRGELGDIARVGKQFVSDPTPNSGTAQRLLAQSLLTSGLVGSGYLSGADPTTVGGLALAGLTTGRMANKILNSPASGRAMMAPVRKLSDLAMEAPGVSSMVIGGGTGMTLADLLGRKKDQ